MDNPLDNKNLGLIRLISQNFNLLATSEPIHLGRSLGDGVSSAQNSNSNNLNGNGKAPHQPAFFPLGSSKNISRVHAEIVWSAVNENSPDPHVHQNGQTPEGGWHLRCLGKNGLQLNNEFITNEENPLLLYHLDRIAIADTVLFIILGPNQQQRFPPRTLNHKPFTGIIPDLTAPPLELNNNPNSKPDNNNFMNMNTDSNNTTTGLNDSSVDLDATTTAPAGVGSAPQINTSNSSLHSVSHHNSFSQSVNVNINYGVPQGQVNPNFHITHPHIYPTNPPPTTIDNMHVEPTNK